MSRRLPPTAVIVLAGLSLWMHGCAGTSHTAAGPRESKPDSVPLRLACRLANYGQYADIALTHLQSIGVRYAFTNVPTAERCDGVRRELADHGLTALVLRGDVDFTKDTALDTLESQLAVCERMGVAYMFLSVKGHWPEKAVIYERLRRAGDLAGRHQVTLAIETHPELGTNADVQLETMRGVHHPNVRVNFDTGNITYYNRGRDAAGELKRIIDYVATVEIKDHDGQPESWAFPALGKGVVNIPEVVKILRTHHYHGPVTIEIEGIKGTPWNEDQTKAAVAESVSYLRSLGGF